MGRWVYDMHMPAILHHARARSASCSWPPRVRSWGQRVTVRSARGLVETDQVVVGCMSAINALGRQPGQNSHYVTPQHLILLLLGRAMHRGCCVHREVHSLPPILLTMQGLLHDPLNHAQPVYQRIAVSCKAVQQRQRCAKCWHGAQLLHRQRRVRVWAAGMSAYPVLNGVLLKDVAFGCAYGHLHVIAIAAHDLQKE